MGKGKARRKRRRWARKRARIRVMGAEKTGGRMMSDTRRVECVRVRWGPDGYGLFDVSEDGTVLGTFCNRGGRHDEDWLRKKWLDEKVSHEELRAWAGPQYREATSTYSGDGCGEDRRDPP
jgi:hypothetical protein